MARMPHYHVVTQFDGRLLDYTDGLTEPGAVAYATELISPLSGGREEGLEGVWIVQVGPGTCPLAHGDDPGKDSEEILIFLERVVQDEPYWSEFS